MTDHPFWKALADLNAMHSGDNATDPDLEAIYAQAKIVEAMKPEGIVLQTDFISGDEWCSPWDYWCDTADEYVSIVAGFQLETDERVIDWSKPMSWIRFVNMVRRLLDMGVDKQVVLDWMPTIACIEDIDEDPSDDAADAPDVDEARCVLSALRHIVNVM